MRLGYSGQTSDIPLVRASDHNLDYGLHRENYFRFAYEASDFYEDRSGRVEHRLETALASSFVAGLDRLVAGR
jgi:hypothetical protein